MLSVRALWSCNSCSVPPVWFVGQWPTDFTHKQVTRHEPATHAELQYTQKLVYTKNLDQIQITCKISLPRPQPSPAAIPAARNHLFHLTRAGRMAAAASVDKQALQQLCHTAGQEHLLQDWDSLSSTEQQQLADDIQASIRSSSSSRSALGASSDSLLRAPDQPGCTHMWHMASAGAGLPVHQESAAGQPSSSSSCACKVPARHRCSDTQGRGPTCASSSHASSCTLAPTRSTGGGCSGTCFPCFG